MRTYLAFVTGLLSLILVVPACGGGSGGGGTPLILGIETLPETEPNNSTVGAAPLLLGTGGTGNLFIAGDVDFWKFQGSAGQYVRIQIFALRRDQATWDAASNAAVITLLAPDGVTRIAEHDINGDVLPSATTGGNFDRDLDCVRLDATGEHYIRVSQDAPALAGGRYAVSVESVSLLGVQLEGEAEGVTGVNDTAPTAQFVSLGVVQGSIAAAEADFYRFQVVQVPSIVSVEMKAWRLGASAASTDVRILQADLIGSDQATVLGSVAAGYGFDALISHAVTTPGAYYIRVPSPAAAANIGRYQLHYSLRAVGAISELEGNNSFPAANALLPGQFVNGSAGAGDNDFFSFAGTKGDMGVIRVWANSNHGLAANDVTVSLLAPDGVTPMPATIGLDSAARLREARFILQQSGMHFVRISGAVAATPYILRNVLLKAAASESEPNNVMGGANGFDAGGRASGVMDANGDVDWYGLSAQKNELVTIRCFGNGEGAGVDFLRNFYGSSISTVLRAFDAGGAEIARATAAPANARYAHGLVDRVAPVELSFLAPNAGPYFVAVSDAFGLGGPLRFYLLERR